MCFQCTSKTWPLSLLSELNLPKLPSSGTVPLLLPLFPRSPCLGKSDHFLFHFLLRYLPQIQKLSISVENNTIVCIPCTSLKSFLLMPCISILLLNSMTSFCHIRHRKIWHLAHLATSMFSTLSSSSHSFHCCHIEHNSCLSSLNMPVSLALSARPLPVSYACSVFLL